VSLQQRTYYFVNRQDQREATLILVPRSPAADEHCHVPAGHIASDLRFSKSWNNLRGALAPQFAHYNLCRIHASLRITPAMAAGIADHVWEIEGLISK
jgi:hypothetical protein